MYIMVLLGLRSHSVKIVNMGAKKKCEEVMIQFIGPSSVLTY